MITVQPGILAPVPAHARYVELRLNQGATPATVRARLAALVADERLVVGLGPQTLARLGLDVAGMHGFVSLSGRGCEVPATQTDLWLWQRGSDRGVIAHQADVTIKHLSPVWVVERVTDGFVHAGGRDLTGYEDGTENPKGAAARRAAVVGQGPWRGSSFVSIQQWQHDMPGFHAMGRQQADNAIGRRLSDNKELAGAPASAHVKRTAQESFDPPAFLLRRSMPWLSGREQGLMFVAFAASLYPFEVQMKRMAGLADGIRDGLFRFSRPLTGSHFWCPAINKGRLVLG